MALLCRAVVPDCGLNVVQWQALSVVAHQPQIELGIGEPLLGSPLEPPCCQSVILGDPDALVVSNTEPQLRRRIACMRRLRQRILGATSAGLDS